MDRIGHEPSKWEDIENRHMTHEFWGKFGTYIGKHAKNKRIWLVSIKLKKTQKQAM